VGTWRRRSLIELLVLSPYVETMSFYREEAMEREY